MYDIKAHEVIYRGAHFRSKNECKRYIFFKQLGWNIEYEPVLEDVKGWLPDFAIYGDKGRKILVEVKPYQTREDFETDYAKSIEKKIHNSGWYGNYDSVLIFGSVLSLGEDGGGGYSFVGGKCWRSSEYRGEHHDHYLFDPNEEKRKIVNNHIYDCDDFFAYSNESFKYKTSNIDVCDEYNSYIGHIYGSYNGGYSLSKKGKEKIETAWNHAGSEMRYVKRVA
jgi:hypothetical protein|tara:strand:- start:116 stop:784 length:669 start_codon:yes stop_codon:yes gene_type:complete